MQEFLQSLFGEIRGGWRYRWWAMGIAWVVCVIGWIGISAMPDVYSARAQVFVDADSRLAEVMGEVGVEPGVTSRVYIVRQAMLGRPQLERVAEETGLVKRAATLQEHDELITELQKLIRVRSGNVRQTQNLYTITFDDSDREIAIAVVRALLDTFVEDVLNLKEQGTEDVSGYLEDQLAYYSGLLSKAELDLANFRKEYVGLLPGDSGGIFERLQVEMDQVRALRAELQIEEDQREELRRQLQGETPYLSDEALLSSGAPVPGSETENAIDELEARRATMLLTFTERHPDVVAINEQLEQLYAKREDDRASLAAQGGGMEGASNSTNPVYQSIQIALNQSSVVIAGLRSQVQQRQAMINTLNSQINTIPEVEAQYAELNRDYDQYQSLYNELLVRKERERLGSVGDERDVVSFNIIDPPAAPFEPVSPRRAFLIFAVLVAGLGLGGLVAFALHQLRPVFHDAKSLREFTGLPVLGVVSMTWLEKHKTARRVDLTSFTMAGIALLSVFVLTLLFKNQIAGAMGMLLEGLTA